MDLKKQIINLKTGKPYQKALTVEERDENIKENGKFDITKVENETVGNVILHCLSFYSGEDKISGFYANMLAQKILYNESEIEITESIKKYLSKILDKCIIKVETNKKGEEQVVGLYQSWIISQIFQEIGETFE